MSTRHRETITSKISNEKKPQVSGEWSGRASGTRTRNLWIKSHSCGVITGFDLEKGVPGDDA
jgi:hypothetical protein